MDEVNYYYKTRYWVIGTSLLLGAVLPIICVGYGWALLCVLLIAAVVGMVAGFIAWCKLLENVSNSKRPIQYFDQSYAGRIVFSMAILGPAAVVIFIPELFWCRFILAVYFLTWPIYEIVFYSKIRNHELKNGAIAIKEFYGKSRSGQAGMIGKQGKVKVVCDPKGKVEICNELWNAINVDEEPLLEKELVSVVDIEGLTVYVEKNGTIID